MTVPRYLLAVLGAIVAVCWHAPVAAQGFPIKPVQIVVPFPPGSGLDVLTRAVAAQLADRWKQSVIVENKAGAGSVIGATQVAKASPDGYTLLSTVNQTVVTARYLYKALPYDPDKDFEPITMMGKSDQLLVANAAFPANTLREAVALAKRQPGKIAFGSYGNGSQPHLLYELVNNRESVDMLHVPYGGIAPMLTALAGGQVALGTVSYGVAAPLLQAGKIKAIAVAGSQRVPQLPDVSTTAEQGYPYATATIWTALFAPSGTPAPVVEKIRSEVRSILTNPEFASKHVKPLHMSIVASDGEQLRRSIQEEARQAAEMIAAARVVPE